MEAGALLATELPTVGDQDARLSEIREAGKVDVVYAALAAAVQEGSWPSSKAELERQDPSLLPYFKYRNAFRWVDGLVLHGARLVIPRALVPATVRQVHAAHQGEEKSLERARRVVWWPTLTNDVLQVVRRCTPCQEHRPAQAHKPLQRNPDAERPFQRVHADFFEEAGQHYLVITDEYSGCPMLYCVGQDTTAGMVVKCLRQLFVQWEVPTVLRSDNGPQFAAAQTQTFLQKWGVTFEPSSPRLPRTNGRAEAAVKAMKRLVRGATPFGSNKPDENEIAEGLLAFRNTSRYGGRSPAELAFGRRAREALPMHWQSLEDPRWAADVRELDDTATARRERLAHHYEATAKPLEPFPVGALVAVEGEGNNGKGSVVISTFIALLFDGKMRESSVGATKLK
jgi:transposase InsO family protein